MTILFETFELHELMPLLEAQNFRDVSKQLGHKRFHKLYKLIKPYQYARIIHNNIAQSTTVALEAASYPLLTLWTVTSLIEVAASMLAFITSFAFALMLMTFAIYFSSTYSEINKTTKKNALSLQFAIFKLIVTNEIVNALKKEVNPENWVENTSSFPTIHPSKTHLSKVRDSIGISLMVGATLFGTYYLGVHAIITAFQISTIALAMSSPIGLGIACACALGVGLYLAYKHYQVYKHAEIMRKTHKALNQSIDDRCKEYFELMGLKKHQLVNQKNSAKLCSKMKSTLKPNNFQYTFAKNPVILLNKKRFRLTTKALRGRNLLPKNKSHLCSFT